jgi:hypothetical protein
LFKKWLEMGVTVMSKANERRKLSARSRKKRGIHSKVDVFDGFYDPF